MIRLNLAFGMGAVLAVPVFLWESWRFVQRALLPKEKKGLVLIVPFSVLLFALGGGLALFVVVPISAKFLLGFGSDALQPMISIKAYLSFLFWTVMGFGAIFQLPLVTFFLVRLGIIDARTLSLYRVHVIVGIAILSAFLTPGGDVVPMAVLSIFAYGLFEVALWVSFRLSPGGKAETGPER